jgi:hypothetical protein
VKSKTVKGCRWAKSL